jgi:MFS family permease
MASVDASIVIISLPAIFRGIDLDPLEPRNVGYLLWMLMGYLVVTSVLVVTVGRVGASFGRVRMYNAGFAVFTLASIALSLTPNRAHWGDGTHRHADRPGHRRCIADGELHGIVTAFPFTSGVWRWASATSPGWPGPS